MKTFALAIAATLALTATASAHSWKHESGKHYRHYWRSPYDWPDKAQRYFRELYRTTNLQSPGECRTWHRGVPPCHPPPPHFY